MPGYSYFQWTRSGVLKLKIRKATKLKKAAKVTAVKGDNTLVDTTVAIEFAES
jgi:hypothetical protein